MFDDDVDVDWGEMKYFLRESVMQGDQENVRYIFDRADVEEVEDFLEIDNEPPWWGQTPLYLACQHGNYPRSVSMIAELTEKFPQWLEHKTSAGQTPLWVACKEGHLPVVVTLIEYFQANVHARSLDGRSPLWVASWMGHFEVVKYLVLKASANSEDFCDTGHLGTTVVQSARAAGHKEIAEWLEGIVQGVRKKRAKRRFRVAAYTVFAFSVLKLHMNEVMFTPEDVSNATKALEMSKQRAKEAAIEADRVRNERRNRIIEEEARKLAEEEAEAIANND